MSSGGRSERCFISDGFIGTIWWCVRLSARGAPGIGRAITILILDFSTMLDENAGAEILAYLFNFYFSGVPIHVMATDMQSDR